MSEDQAKTETSSGGSGIVIVTLLIVAAVAVASYWVGTKSAKDAVNTCQCQCQMPKCEKVECPPQILVEEDYSVRPIRVTPCRCEAWCAGGGSPACRIMKPGDSSYVPDNVTCEEN